MTSVSYDSGKFPKKPGRRYCLKSQARKYNYFANFVLPEEELQATRCTEVHPRGGRLCSPASQGYFFAICSTFSVFFENHRSGAFTTSAITQ